MTKGKASAIVLSADERQELESLARRHFDQSGTDASGADCAGGCCRLTIEAILSSTVALAAFGTRT